MSALFMKDSAINVNEETFCQVYNGGKEMKGREYMYFSLHGMWTADIGDGKAYPMQLPGTLDENKIGYKDTGANQWHPDASLGNQDEAFQAGIIATRFTRRYTYEGAGKLTRRIDADLWKEIKEEIKGTKRIFLEAERARVVKLLVDGKEVTDFIKPSISTSHVFEVTGLLKENSELILISDNSYPGLPHDAIVYSSAATDETQTNWNGILGYLRLRTEERVFVDEICVYPVKNTITVRMKLYASTPYQGTIRVCCDALKEDAIQQVSTSEAVTEVIFENLSLKETVQRWDLEEGNLYSLLVSMDEGEEKRVTFGVRDFKDGGMGRLAINGRTIFLRSEENCAEFPETGHPPMTVDAWLEILERYRSYGVNCVRFHSHCPPEAAFSAADRIGMLMQPELSHWNPKDAFESEESYQYYKTELVQILKLLANHPSFVMMTFGNELHATGKGYERMRKLLQLARRIDPTRLYADASNGHYGMEGCEAENDFYTSSNYYEQELRGTYAEMKGYMNHAYPNACRNYDAAMRELRKEYAKPEHFRSFFRDELPLVLLPKYTWENTEKLVAKVQVANFGKGEICGKPVYELMTQSEKNHEKKILARGVCKQVSCPQGKLTDAGTIEIMLPSLAIEKPMRLNLMVHIGEHSNQYPVWVYPQKAPVCPKEVYETTYLDEKAKEILMDGGSVYLTPLSTKEALPSSIQAQFTSDFWSVGTFAGQEGAMGQLIDSSHPIFERFPTEFHTNWQWWAMATQRAIILPQRYEAIITEMDSYAFLRPMAQLLECRCQNGRLMLSTMGLQNLQQYPEARALLDAIYQHMASDQFMPKQEISMDVIEQLVRAVPAPDTVPESCPDDV